MDKKRRRVNTDDDDIAEDPVPSTKREEIIAKRMALEKERIENLKKLEEKKHDLKQKKTEIKALEGLVQQDSQEPSTPAKTTAPKTDDDMVEKMLQDNIEKLVAMQLSENQVLLNINGTKFKVSKQAVMRTENIFRTMMDTNFGVDKDEDGAITIDERSPKWFHIIIEFLRTGRLNKIGIPEDDNKALEEILEESDFYGTIALSKKITSLIQANASKTSNQTIKKQNSSDDGYSQSASYKEDEEWLEKFDQLTLEQKQKEDEYFAKKNSKYESKDAKLEARKNAVLQKDSKGLHKQIKLNVRGRIFLVNLTTFTQYKDMILNAVFAKNPNHSDEIFLDSDPDVFAYILEYLKSGSTKHFPQDHYRLKQIKEEAKFLNIPSLVEYFDPLRYPIESIGEENIAIKKNEDLLRKLFAVQRDHVMLSDPFVHLIPVFDQVETFKSKDPISSIPLMFDFENPEYYNNMELPTHLLNHAPAKPAIASSMSEFIEHWNAFTGNMLNGLDWSHTFVAGSSVLACMLQVSEEALGKLTPKNSNDRFSRRYFWNMQEDKVSRVRQGNDSDSDVEQEKPEDSKYEKKKDESDQSEYSEDVFTDSEEEKKTVTQPMGLGFGLPYPHLFPTPVVSTPQPDPLPAPPISKSQLLYKYYNQSCFRDADIDLFLYALSEEEAEKKIAHIYKTLKDNLKNKVYSQYVEKVDDNRDRIRYRYYYQQQNQPALNASAEETSSDPKESIFVIRSGSAVSFHMSYPLRTIQVVLRIYKSPAEVLIGFDLDSCCVGFDGTNVYALPRARRAIQQRMNLVDVERQSTTFELRLFKYAKRGFRIGVPGLNRKRIKEAMFYDATINPPPRGVYSYWARRNRTTPPTNPRKDLFSKVNGLARLLLFETSLTMRSTHQAFARIGLQGTRSENVDDKLEYWTRLRSNVQILKTKSDYMSIFVPRKMNITPHVLYRRFQGIKSFQIGQSKKPQFIFTLNDIDTILLNTKHSTSLPERIAWITVEPGRQSIGSFHPHERNFYKDAYSTFKTGEAKVEETSEDEDVQMIDMKKKKKRAKIAWSWEENIQNHTFKAYPKNQIVAIEKAYREYVKKGRPSSLERYELNDAYYINFAKNRQINKKDEKRQRKVQRTKTPIVNV